MLSGENFVADLHDELARLARETLAGVVGKAVAFFRMAYAVIISLGMRSFPMLKCSNERCVCAPQSLSAGTFTSPRLSVSIRYSGMRLPYVPKR